MRFDDRRLSMRVECWLCLYPFVFRKTYISFAKKQSVGFDDRHSTSVRAECCSCLHAAYPVHLYASLRKSYLLREKTANKVVRGLKLKLKTSPTKFTLASLKKIWKQAGRRHKNATLSLPKVPTLPRSISATEHRYMPIQARTERGFIWRGPRQIPMMSDEGKFPKKDAKNRKNSAITSRRDQRVKVDKFRCHSRGACAAEFSQRERMFLKRLLWQHLVQCLCSLKPWPSLAPGLRPSRRGPGKTAGHFWPFTPISG